MDFCDGDRRCRQSCEMGLGTRGGLCKEKQACSCPHGGGGGGGKPDSAPPPYSCVPKQWTLTSRETGRISPPCVPPPLGPPCQLAPGPSTGRVEKTLACSHWLCDSGQVDPLLWASLLVPLQG